jgi:hypothetical protein
MSWVAVDRAIRLATERGRPAPLDQQRDARHEQVRQRGWNGDRGAFVQHYDHTVLDLSLLHVSLRIHHAGGPFRGGDYSIVVHVASSSCRKLSA